LARLTKFSDPSKRAHMTSSANFEAARLPKADDAKS